MNHRTLSSYSLGHKLGEGTYGSVYLAKDAWGRQVALKKISKTSNNAREGLPITAVREIKILKELNHELFVQLLDVVPEKHDERSDIYMVFEYLEHDLAGLMEADDIKISMDQAKYYMKRVIESLYECHKRQIIHRDVKGSNILISNKGNVKLADWGLARKYIDNENYAERPLLSNRVVTLWYRAPELLLGSTTYDYKVDMWSIGCVFVELLCNSAIFGGSSEFNQLIRIFELCGYPNEETWPQVKTLPWYNKFISEYAKNMTKESYSSKLHAEYKDKCTPHALDLLCKLLSLNPNDRPTAAEALKHPYFTIEEPKPLDPAKHPSYGKDYHEFEIKLRRTAKQQQHRKRKRTSS